jgi:hypothetical protein
MPSIINSDDGVVSGTSGLKTTGGNDGILTFQRNGTEAMRIDSAGITKFRSTGSAYDSTPGDGISDGLYLQVDSSGIAHIDSYAGGGSTILSFGTNSGGGAVAERMRLDSSGNFQFNSGYGSVATAYGCRAWVNFNGTGTVAIRGSGNVTSITDGGVGIYTVNLTNAMPDANYAVTYGVIPDVAFSSGSSAARQVFLNSQTSSSFVMNTGYQANGSTAAVGFLDYPTICVSVFR